MAAAAGSKLADGDISTAHRLGGSFNPEKTRPVIVRFTSRRKKKDLMSKKKALRQSHDYKEAFICDDLTRMRHSVYRLAKEKHDYTFTKDGIVISKVKDKYVYLRTPEDLFDIGYEDGEVDFMKRFGFDV